MELVFSFILLFILLLIYFKIADKYNIIDKPNHRSAHKEITLRGGGIIYPLSFLLFCFFNFSLVEEHYWSFGIGLMMLCTISFIDDIVDLSSRIRLIFHFISVTLLLCFFQAFQVFPFWTIPLLYVLVIGILNAYNFMDGINGMSGLYSLAVLITLWYINEFIVSYTVASFIIFPIIASIIFLFFNFRKKAKCFMGDIGSMGIAFWIVAIIGLLILKTEQYKYILLLTVYGVEVIYTIIERILLKENIFEAHRRHLYQLLANEKKISHLTISFFYTFIQLIINIIIVKSNSADWVLCLLIILFTSIVYLFIKAKIKKELSQ